MDLRLIGYIQVVKLSNAKDALISNDKSATFQTHFTRTKIASNHNFRPTPEEPFPVLHTPREARVSSRFKSYSLKLQSHTS